MLFEFLTWRKARQIQRDVHDLAHPPRDPTPAEQAARNAVLKVAFWIIVVCFVVFLIFGGSNHS